MCQALVTAAAVQDDSSSLLGTLSSSLLSAFSAEEVSLASGKNLCSAALLEVSALAKKGYLNGVESASQILADLISSFTVLSNATARDGNSSVTQYPVNKAVSKAKNTHLQNSSKLADFLVYPTHSNVMFLSFNITGEQSVAWCASRNGSRRVSYHPPHT